MKKKVVLSIILFNMWIVSFTYSDTNQKGLQWKIFGEVTDNQTGYPLAGANVSLKGEETGGISDDAGRFEIRLKNSPDTLIISFMGYETRKIQVKRQETHETVIVNVQLVPIVLKGETVQVSAEADGRTISSYTINGNRLRELAAPRPDPLLMVQTLPGVTSRHSLSSRYQVRGGHFDENLIYIDGFEIYQSHLIRRGILENSSIVNPLLVRSLHLQTGSFPVSYGDKLSSALDLQYETLPQRKIEVLSEVGTLGGNAVLRARYRDNFSLALGIRRQDYGLLSSAFYLEGNYDSDYSDAQISLDWHLFGKIQVQALGIVADNSYRMNPQEYDYKRYQTITRVITELFYSPESYEQHRFNTLLGGIRFLYPLKNGLVSMEYSRFKQNEAYNQNLTSIITQKTTLLNEDDIVSQDSLTLSEYGNGKWEGLYSTYKINGEYALRRGVRLSSGIQIKRADISKFASGFTANQQNDLGYTVYQHDETLTPISDLQKSLSAGYVMADIAFSKRIETQWGVRFLHDQMTGESLWLPRFFARYNLQDFGAIVLSAGKYAQPAVEKDLVQAVDYQKLRAQKSTSMTLGYQGKIKSSLSAKLEAYYKDLTDLISFDIHDLAVRYSGENDSKGFAYGMDCQLIWDLDQRRQGWISYSYLKTEEDIFPDDLGYVARPTDRRHQLSIMFESAMERFQNSRAFMRIVYASGYPYTPKYYRFDTEVSEYVPVETVRNSSRLPIYGRFDLGFSQRWMVKDHIEIIFREEILNVANHQNIIEYEWYGSEKVATHIAGRAFNLSLRFLFQ